MPDLNDAAINFDGRIIPILTSLVKKNALFLKRPNCAKLLYILNYNVAEFMI